MWPHLVLPHQPLMKDSVEVSDHVPWWSYVVSPHHHDTQQSVGHGLAATVGRRQCQGLLVEQNTLITLELKW